MEKMDNYMMFFGFCMFVIGAIVGRITMAIQYEIMKSIAKSKPKKKEDYGAYTKKKPKKLEYEAKDEGSAKKDFYEYMSKRL